ncbi:uncharacterized protein [Panulirus ornatus]|uniref:uncharacterized protein n=1 Tax=Panulirus ornatus TaxID=150431 RepID=UPI003A83DC2B
MWKLVVAVVTMLVVTGTCLPQEVPGLAYIEIFRTAPRTRVGGAAPELELPPSPPLAQGSNRRYHTLLDYSYDYFSDEMVDDNDAEDVSSDVIVTLERPQSSEPLLSTDVSDYVIVSLDTLGHTGSPGTPTRDDHRTLENIPSSSMTPHGSHSSSRPPTSPKVERLPLATAERPTLATAERPTLATADGLPLAVADRPPLAISDRPPLATADQLSLATAERPPLATAEQSDLAITERLPLAEAEQPPLNTAERYLNAPQRSPFDAAQRSPHEIAKPLMDTMDLLPSDTAEHLSTQKSQESTLYAVAVPAPINTKIPVGEKGTLFTSASNLRYRVPNDSAFVGPQFYSASYLAGAYHTENFPSDSHAIGAHPQGNHAPDDSPIELSPLQAYPVEYGYYYPLGRRAAEVQRRENSLSTGSIRRDSRSDSLSRTALLVEHPSKLSLTPSGSISGREYQTENLPTASHQLPSLSGTYHPSVREHPLTIYPSTSQLADKRNKLRTQRVTHDNDSASRLMSTKISPKVISNRRSSLQRRPTESSTDGSLSTDGSFYRRLSAGVDARNKDEILYYTGLQREIERSDVLMDAIKDVRAREGKFIKSNKRKSTTTTITPVPNMKEVRDKFGSHPLYYGLAQPRSLETKSRSIYQTGAYDDDQGEQLYLPLRDESLEPKDLHKVRGHLDPLLPQVTYETHNFPKHSTYQDQKVTTYRPMHSPVYSKYQKPLTPLTSKTQYESPVILRDKANQEPPLLSSSKHVPFGNHHRDNPVAHLPHKPTTHSSVPFKRSKLSNLSRSRNYNPDSSKGYVPVISGNYGVSNYRTQKPSTFRTYILSTSRHRIPSNIRSYDYPSIKNYRPSSSGNYNSPNTKNQPSSTGSYDSPRIKKHQPSSERSIHSPSIKNHQPSSTRSFDSPSIKKHKSSSTRGHNSSTSRHQRQSFGGQLGRIESKFQSSSGREPFLRLKRGNSRQPTTSLYKDSRNTTTSRHEDTKLLVRPDQEESVRQKRGPDMETLLHAHVKFPKYGYDIDPYFGNFPTFGFFDYDPSKEN